MKKIIAVPESIPRKAFLELIEGLGLQVNFLRRLDFHLNGVYAEVFETNAEGRHVIEDGDVVVNRVWIPLDNGY